MQKYIVFLKIKCTQSAELLIEIRYQNCCWQYTTETFFRNWDNPLVSCRTLSLYNTVLFTSDKLTFEGFSSLRLCCSMETNCSWCFLLWKLPYVAYKWICTKLMHQNADWNHHSRENYQIQLFFPIAWKVLILHLTEWKSCHMRL